MFMSARKYLSKICGLCAFISTTANAQSLPPFPTHCTPTEFSVVNAKMGRIDDAQSRLSGRQVIARNGKVLSLCADSPHASFGRLVYRYGPIGSVEFERTASSTSKFCIDSRPTSPHTGEDMVFFSVGKFTYYIAIATAQGRGVSLVVFDSNKKVLDLFSGTVYGTDFEFGPAEMDFEKVTSPVFKHKRAKHGF
jgi:hypothetical protein